MKRNSRLLALALCLTASCGNGNMNEGDMGGAVDMGGGIGDLGNSGQTALGVLAGLPGGDGDADGTGALARFAAASGVAGDSAGNLYVASQNPQNGAWLIRKVVIATGAVTTLSLPANNNIRYLVGDGAGNFYGSSVDSIVKLVPASGTETTIAGGIGAGSADGTGAAAGFNGTQDLAWDSAGNLYIADSLNNTIRKVVVASGAVTTIAGMAGMSGSADGTGAAARFSRPFGVAWDGVGSLYVSDQNNYTIRKVVVATGAVTTVAGTAGISAATDGTGAAAHFSSPGALAYDGAGNLYVCDTKL